MVSDVAGLDQVSSVREVCEKCVANGKDGFFAVMDLRKSHHRHAMWQIQ